MLAHYAVNQFCRMEMLHQVLDECVIIFGQPELHYPAKSNEIGLMLCFGYGKHRTNAFHRLRISPQKIVYISKAGGHEPFGLPGCQISGESCCVEKSVGSFGIGRELCHLIDVHQQP